MQAVDVLAHSRGYFATAAAHDVTSGGGDKHGPAPPPLEGLDPARPPEALILGPGEEVSLICAVPVVAGGHEEDHTLLPPPPPRLYVRWGAEAPPGSGDGRRRAGSSRTTAAWGGVEAPGWLKVEEGSTKISGPALLLAAPLSRAFPCRLTKRQQQLPLPPHQQAESKSRHKGRRALKVDKSSSEIGKA